MLKNLVFDYGNVLVRFSPEYMTSQYTESDEETALLAPIVFDRLYWDKLDYGTITDDELLSAVKARLPEKYHKKAELIYGNWYYNLPETTGMREMIGRLKEKYGLRVFILSNVSTGFAAAAPGIRSLDVAEKCIFSAACGLQKPHADMFEYMLGHFGIERTETLFVDDRQDNTKGAEACGIAAYRFDGNVPALEKFIEEMLSRTE